MTLKTVEATLEDLESKVSLGLRKFYEAGMALMEIRDRKLYRSDYQTFDDYCQQRWGFKRGNAYQLIAAAEVVSTLSAVADILPISERQVRPLTKLPPQQQQAAWELACQMTDSIPTGQTVERAAAAVTNRNKVEVSPGEIRIVQSPKSEHFGQTITIEKVDDVIITGTLDGGRQEYFLINELAEPKPELNWTDRQTKTDRLESAEAQLQISELRIQILESMLKRVIIAVKENSVSIELLNAAEQLIG